MNDLAAIFLNLAIYLPFLGASSRRGSKHEQGRGLDAPR